MRLIDADVLLERMKRTNRYFNVKFDIDEAPTVDAVPVVRCRECGWREDELCGHPKNDVVERVPEIGKYYRIAVHQKVDKNHFCSYGERREVDGDG